MHCFLSVESLLICFFSSKEDQPVFLVPSSCRKNRHGKHCWQHSEWSDMVHCRRRCTAGEGRIHAPHSRHYDRHHARTKV